MTDDQKRTTLGAVIDGIVGAMTPEQFAAFAKRTGHDETPQEAAAQALTDLVRSGNLDRLTTSQLADRLRRHL